MKPTPDIIQFAIDTLIAETVQKYAQDKSLPGTAALRFFMRTETYKLLANPESFLYLESVEYVLDMLDAELCGDIERWLEV